MATQNMIDKAYSATPTASTIATWDANSNLSANSLLEGYTTTATAAGTTTLTVASTYLQFFTGSTTQTVKMPVTSTLVLGQSWFITNQSTGVVTVQSSGSNTILAMGSNTSALITCILTSGTSETSWYASYLGGTGTGTVNAGTSGQLAYYASSGNTVSGLTPGVTLSYVKQVVQTVDTTNRSTTSASYVTSNISVSITPSSNTNRVRISFYGLAGHNTVATISEYTLYRDSTPLTPSGVTSMAASYMITSNVTYQMFSIDFIDSPATTSAITYALYFRTSGGTTYLGRRGSDTTIDNCCVITAEELSA